MYLLRKLSLILLVAMVTFSCDSTENPLGPGAGDYFMRYKSNGTQVEYANSFLLTYGSTQSGAQYLATISGANDASSNLSLLLYDDAPFSETTYSDYIVSGGITYGVIIAHKDGVSGENFGSGGVDVDATVTISDLNDAFVSGTFQGIVKRTGFPDITITEGEFKVKKVF